MQKISGTATINNGRFSFKSVLPSDQLVTMPQALRGRLLIHPNADAEFLQHQSSTTLPPDITPVSIGPNYRIKRSTQNYLVQLKLPVGSSHSFNELLLSLIMDKVLYDIDKDQQ